MFARPWVEAAALGCFLLSGAAGLVYEICWIRRASLIFGSTQEALSTVLAVFFLGLAAGSALFGRLALTSARPLRMVAVLELALAAAALASVPLFEWADAAYGGLYRSFTSSPTLLSLGRIGLVSLILLPPTVLMGGTLPLFVRQFVTRRTGILHSVGMLYAINTLGAAIGCALAGATLLPALGLRSCMALGAGANILAGIVAAVLRIPPPVYGDADAAERTPRPAIRSVERKPRAATRSRDRGEAPDERSKLRGVVLAVLVASTGFTALAYEVVWTRFASLLVYNTVTTYTVTLTIVLLGIVLGSWVGSWLFRRSHRAAAIFGWMQVLSGLAVMATLSAPPNFWWKLGHPLVTYVVLMLPAAVFSGASFPLAVRLAVRAPEGAALGAGQIAMLNTLGGIAGALAAGFLGLPRLGMQTSVTVLTAMSLLAGFAAWLVLERPGVSWRGGVAIAASLVAWLGIPRLWDTRVPADFLADRAALVDLREGKMSNVTVVRQLGTLSLWIDRLWQGQDRRTHQIMAAHIPMMLHNGPRRVLVVGLGSGQTASRFLDYDIERLDGIDIEPAVIDVIRSHFDSGWTTDPRVRLLAEDGRNHVIHARDRYDLISLEVGQIFRPGTASFYTVDFYRSVRERLEPGGLVSQFVPIAFLPPEVFRRVIASFIEVFPHSTLWYNTAELLLLGSNADRVEVDPRRVERLLSTPRLRQDLDYRHWGGADRALRLPHMFFGGFLCGRRGLNEIAGGAAVYRDDRPELDYAAGGVRLGGGYELECLELLRPHVETPDVLAPGAFPPESLSAMRTIQARNLDQIVSNRLLEPVWIAPNIAAERPAIEAALRANPENSKANGVMGDALVASNRVEEAIGYYQRAVELRPEDGTAQLDLANALARLGRSAEAVAHYRAAVDVGVRDAGIYTALGVSLARSGDSTAAIPPLEEALRLDPGHGPARQALGDLRAVTPPRP